MNCCKCFQFVQASGVSRLVAAFALVCLMITSSSKLSAGPHIATDGAQNPPIGFRFAGVLSEFAVRWKVAVVAEGTPLEEKSATQADSGGDTMDSELARICAAFDYESRRTNNIVVLIKRYSDKRDLPDVTADELAHSTIAAANLFGGFNPRFPANSQGFSTRAAGIAALLTPEQLRVLSKDGLPVNSLSPAQREEAWRVALGLLMQDWAEEVQKSADGQRNYLMQDPLFHHQTIAGIPAIGYEYVSGSPRHKIFIPISQSNRLNVDDDGRVVTFTHDVQLHNGVPEVSEADSDPHTAPTASLASIAVSPATRTLAEVVGTIDARQDLRSENTIDSRNSYRVNPNLASKSVTIAGERWAKNDHLMSALAEAYGLRLSRGPDHIILLTQPETPKVRNVSELKGAMRAVIPAPVLRLYNARIPVKFRPLSVRYLGRFDSFAADLYQNCSRSLTVTIDDRLQKSPVHELRVSDLSPQEQKMLALARAAAGYNHVCYIAEGQLPVYIENFDNAILTGGISIAEDGSHRLTLYFSHLVPATGKLQRDGGLVSSRLP